MAGQRGYLFGEVLACLLGYGGAGQGFAQPA
jgi:hypothetical protein